MRDSYGICVVRGLLAAVSAIRATFTVRHRACYRLAVVFRCCGAISARFERV